jgi:tRNA pseudouridine13 synthase
MSKGVDVKEVLTSELSKDQRTAVHQAIRAVFKNKLESQATPSGSIRITYVSRPSKRSRHPPSSWDNGEYCHFTMRKNNRDTMSAASMLSKWLKCHAKVIGYAGTKDRRAVTTQRMSAYRVKAERLAALNKIANPAGIILGDFAYASKPVKLGDLKGNRFTITLREIPSSVGLEQIQNAIKAVGEKGFINYYGMQRFGTSLVSTHSVGALLLNGKWKEACEAILDVKAGAMNDSLEARELYSSGNIESAFENMPRNCIAERAVLGVLKKNPKHYSGAFQAVYLIIFLTHT